MKNIVILILQMLLAISSVSAQTTCKTDFMGNVICAPPGGVAVATYSDEILCAPGQCTSDNMGYLKCSDVVGGGVGKNLLGDVECVGKCISPKKEFCIKKERK
jgi:hypothetical protein